MLLQSIPQWDIPAIASASGHPLHAFWERAWGGDPTTLFEARQVERDTPGQQLSIQLPSNCLVLNLPNDAFDDFEITGVLIRAEYVQALRDMIRLASRDIKQYNERARHSRQSSEFEEVDLPPDPLLSRISTPLNDCLVTDFKNIFGSPEASGAFQRGTVTLIGQPGIGKTLWMYYVLVLRCLACLQTILVTEKESQLIVFCNEGVFTVDTNHVSFTLPLQTWFRQWISKECWCLVDSSQHVKEVNTLLLSLRRFIVQVAEPRSEYFEWTKKVNGIPTVKYFMKPWSLPELIAARPLQNTPYRSEKQLERIFTYYTPSARTLFRQAMNPEIQEQEIREGLEGFNLNVLESMLRTAPRDMSTNLSQNILSIAPSPFRHQCTIDIPTRHLYNLVRDTLQVPTFADAARLYDVLIQNPRTRRTAVYVLEDRMYELFNGAGLWTVHPLARRPAEDFAARWERNGSAPPAYMCLGLKGLPPVIIHDRPPARHTLRQETKLGRAHFSFTEDGESMRLLNAFYWPFVDAGTKPPFELFVYDVASRTATVFQVCGLEKQVVAEEGLAWLAGLGVERVRYVGVTPPDGSLEVLVPDSWGESVFEAYQLVVKGLLDRNMCRAIG